MKAARTKHATTSPPIVVDEITLDGRQIRVQNVELPLNEVRLDPRNPRIANTVAFSMDDADPALQKKLEDLLWSDDDVRELYRQVLANKGLIERIIVRHDGTVAEGNCRTVVYRRLMEKFPKESNWRNIPARVLPEDIGDRGIAILLGEMHVAGKNTWSPFEKAGHVYRMHRDFALTQDEIATRLRMSKSRVNQLIRAFDAMKTKYLTKYPGPASIRKFSYFEELYKKPELRDWIDATKGAEDLFVNWVGTNKLSQGVHVRELAQIVANEEALAALSSDGFETAQRVLSEDNPALTSKLFKTMVDMTEALRKAQLDDIQRVRKPGRSKGRRIVVDLSEALDHFMELCGVERG
jgi:hypothetical protein